MRLRGRAGAVPRLAAAGLALLALAAAAAAGDEIAQKGNLRVVVDGEMMPKKLPRTGTAPIAVKVSGRISTRDDTTPPRLRKLTIEVNRHGRFDFAGLPTCSPRQIQPATTEQALQACAPALVGNGTFFADVILQGQEPYPSQGRLLVFNGRENGRPVLLGQIYSDQPFTNSFVIPFRLEPIRRGTYGTALVATLPRSLGSWGFVTGIEMKLTRRFHHRGRAHSYLSASCPAPKGFGGAVFPLLRTSFAFADGRKLTSTLTRSCAVR